MSSTARAGHRPEVPPPDGGWGWMVVMAAFIAHAIVHGIIYSFGILFIALEERFNGASKSEIAWIPSITSGTLYLIGPLCSILITRYGCRTVTVFGSLLSAVGILLSMFVQNLYLMYVTLGFLTGCGFGLITISAVVVVTKHFNKNRSLACGIALSGAGSGGFIFNPLLERLMDVYLLHGTLFILVAIILNCVPFGMLYRSLRKPQNTRSESLVYGENKHEIQKLTEDLRIVNDNASAKVLCYNNHEDMDTPMNDSSTNDNLQSNGNPIVIEVEETGLLHGNTKEIYTANMVNDTHEEMYVSDLDVYSKVESTPPALLNRYCYMFHQSIIVIFFATQFLFHFGLYLPFIYIPDRAVSLGIEESHAAWVASTIGLSSIAGRIILGYIADRPSVNRILLFKIVMATAGVSVAAVPALNTLWLMIIFAVVFGVSTGIIVTLTSVVLVDCVGMDLLPDVLGLNYLFAGIGSLLGPPFAGFVYDRTGSHTFLFMVPGCAMVVAAILLFMTPLCTKHNIRK